MSPITLGILAASGAATPGSYELISTTTLSSSAASVTFSNLGTAAASYKHLQIRYTARQTASGGNVMIRLNGDSGSNYVHHQLYTFGSGAPGGNGDISQTWMRLGGSTNSSYGANVFAAGIIDLLDFSSSSKNKTGRGLSGVAEPATNYVYLRSGLWMSTAAVTQIDAIADGGSFAINSRFSLYGLRG